MSHTALVEHFTLRHSLELAENEISSKLCQLSYLFELGSKRSNTNQWLQVGTQYRKHSAST